jgi:hypothetical protein
LLGGRVGSAVEERGFEERDAVETPGGVGEFPGELGFGRGGGLVFVEGLAAVEPIGGGVLGVERRGLGAGAWRRSRVCDGASEAVLGDSMGRVVDVVMWEGKMDKGAA